MPVNSYAQLPELRSGFELSPDKGLWGVVVPEATTNLFPNPSWENATSALTGVTFNTSAGARVTTFQTRGSIGVEITPSGASVSYMEFAIASATLGLAINTIYTWSLDILSLAGEAMRLEVRDGASSVLLARKDFTATQQWDRYSLTFQTLGALGTNHLFRLTKVGATTNKYYTDAWQLEAKPYPTTYIDGDQPGGQWAGVIHSSSSTRAFDAQGGRYYNFKDLGFKIMAYQGAGMPSQKNVTTPYGLLGGELYQRTVANPRVILLPGRLQSSTLAGLQKLRQGLINVLAPNFAQQVAENLTLRYQLADCAGIYGNALEIPVKYSGGLEGSTDNPAGENITLQFVELVPPRVQEVYPIRNSLNLSASFTAKSLFKHSATNGWSAIGTIEKLPRWNSLAYSPADNKVYAGGTVALVPKLYYVLGTTITNITPDPGQPIYAIAAVPTAPNALYLGGPSYFQYYNGAAYVNPATGQPNNDVLGICVAKSGLVYFTGIFTQYNGVARAYCAVYDPVGNTVSALGSGFNVQCSDVVEGPDGKIYFGGAVTVANGVAVQYCCRWNGATFEPVGTNLPISPNKLFWGQDGYLYAVDTGTYLLYRFNGTSWVGLGPATSGTQMVGISTDNKGRIIAVGGPGTVNGVVYAPTTSPASSAAVVWTGSNFLPTDFLGNSAGGDYLYAVCPAGGGDFVTSSINQLTGTYAANTDLTYNGTAAAFPQVVFTGPGWVTRLDNLTTGKLLGFSYTLLAGEVATLNLDPLSFSFTSNYFGNVLSKIVPGSDLTSFSLQPGVNRLSCFSTCSKVEVVYRNNHYSVDGGA
jgi:hypothetical protein